MGMLSTSQKKEDNRTAKESLGSERGCEGARRHPRMFRARARGGPPSSLRKERTEGVHAKVRGIRKNLVELGEESLWGNEEASRSWGEDRRGTRTKTACKERCPPESIRNGRRSASL